MAEPGREQRRGSRPLAQASPQSALTDYLANLLEEGTVDVAAVDAADTGDSSPEATATETVPAEADEPTTEPQPDTAGPTSTEARDVPESDVQTPEPVEVPLTPQLTQTETVTAWQENGRPAWAQNRFECLLFKVDGLSLAVPMVLLGTIYPLDRELTSLFGQPDWFLGLYPVGQKRNVRVVETARLVMPEKYRPEAREGLRYAIGIHGCDWALAAHGVEGSITLSPDDVKWRKGRSQRPWLAGTVVDRMCALLDLQALEETLLRDQSGATVRAGSE